MTAWRSLRYEFTAMASPCQIVLDGRDERLLARAADAAIAEVRRIESKYSRYLPASVVSRINAAAGAAPVEVDEETASLLDFAGELWRVSEGLFDATSGVLRRAWDFKQARVPEAAELQALLPLVGWPQVERKAGGVRLPRAGMELDFGGFGKEYAADRAAAVLQQHEVQHALVNLGGDIHVLGPRGLPELQGAPWQIAIARPRPDGEGPLATLPVGRGGLATSGDYERYFEQDGRRYCHILDPRTGWPATAWRSVSVVAPNTTAAGALATVAMLRHDGDAWLKSQNARFLAVRADGAIISP